MILSDALAMSLKLFLILVFSVIEVSIADAKEELAIPSDDPKECVLEKFQPCAISTGDRPRILDWKTSQWEFDRNSVVQITKKGVWKFYKGMVVVHAKEPLQIHTPFADVFLGRSKVMIHLLDDRVRVLSLVGEGIKVKPRLKGDEQFLVPGFQNWYAGIGLDGQEYGVASVFDFQKFAKERARFFLDHKLGYMNELMVVAKSVRWASGVAAKMHKDLIERKMASLDEAHKNKIMKKRKGIKFNKYLRELFLRKINYDD